MDIIEIIDTIEHKLGYEILISSDKDNIVILLKKDIMSMGHLIDTEYEEYKYNKNISINDCLKNVYDCEISKKIQDKLKS